MEEWLHGDWCQLNCTAIVTQNDLFAAGAIAALQKAGISVPEEVSVTGFDGTEMGDYFAPRLTSLEVPFHAIAVRGVELLAHHIADAARPPETIVLPIRLRLRESTAPPPH